jgi:hypothetical protein
MKKLISEDNTMYNVNRQQYGVTARQDSKGETAPQANNTKTFLNANKRDDNSQAPSLKPYPLNMSDEILADLFLSMVNLKKIVQHATSNPTLNKKYMGNVRKIYNKLDEINLAAVEISKELDKIR